MGDMDWRAVNLANWEERAKIHLRSTTGAYVTDEVLAGGSSLHVIEATEIDADLMGVTRNIQRMLAELSA